MKHEKHQILELSDNKITKFTMFRQAERPMGQNRESRNNLLFMWSNGFQQTELGKQEVHRQNNEVGPLPNTTAKN